MPLSAGMITSDASTRFLFGGFSIWPRRDLRNRCAREGSGITSSLLTGEVGLGESAILADVLERIDIGEESYER